MSKCKCPKCDRDLSSSQTIPGGWIGVAHFNQRVAPPRKNIVLCAGCYAEVDYDNFDFCPTCGHDLDDQIDLPPPKPKPPKPAEFATPTRRVRLPRDNDA